MPVWLWHDGHLAWPLFALVVYTVVVLLAADFAWRVVVVSIRLLAPAVVVLWMLGAMLLWTAC